MTRTPVNDFGDHYTNQLYYALFNIALRRPKNKHPIGVEPINNCFEDKRCTNSAKDVLEN